MTSIPEVTVVIPAYNAERFITAAIASVFAQTFANLEIVVIDDGSTDTTSSVVQDCGGMIRCFRQPNSGVALARNRGIAEATGRYVAFLDADDTWHPRKLELQLAALTASGSQCRACFTAHTSVTSELTPLGLHRCAYRQPVLEDLLTSGNVVGTPSTVLVERTLLEIAGGFDPDLSQCADWDMWVRLAHHTPFLYVDEPLVYYRQHDANMSRNVSLLEKDSVRVLEKGFAVPELSPVLRTKQQIALARNYTVLAGSYFAVGSYGSFVRCALRAITLDPRQAGYMLAYPIRVFGRIIRKAR